MTGGKLLFHFFGALAEFERALIMERVEAGRAAARARGVTRGRKPYLDHRRVALAQKLCADKSNSIDFICSTLKIGRATLDRYVKTSSLSLT